MVCTKVNVSKALSSKGIRSVLVNVLQAQAGQLGLIKQSCLKIEVYIYNTVISPILINTTY